MSRTHSISKEAAARISRDVSELLKVSKLCDRTIREEDRSEHDETARTRTSNFYLVSFASSHFLEAYVSLHAFLYLGNVKLSEVYA